MYRAFQIAIAVTRFAFESAFSFGARVGWWKVIAGAAVVIAAGVGVNAIFGSSKAADAPTQSTPLVEVRSVSELSAQSTPLSVVGTVTSKSEASVRAETAGAVASVFHALGDTVSAGTVVVELEDASERAALLQAQGTVDAAQANLDKVQKGTRSEQLAILQAAEVSARSGVVNALLSAYSTVDNAVRGTTDSFFTNPESALPRFNISTTNSQLQINVENQRAALTPILKRESTVNTTLSASADLEAELSAGEKEVRTVRTFLDTTIAALNAGVPTVDVPASTIATYVASASAARTSVNTALSSISSARQALETAQKNLEQGVTGAQAEDIAAAAAALKQAQGSLAAARANLEKSIIRAPISGTINSLSLKRGDYVQPSSPVFTIANNGALEILAYITENDARDIAVGQNVVIDSKIAGVVTRIAPALDPATKKIEVRIGVKDTQSSLINGQSVVLAIDRIVTKVTDTGHVTIPISAIKVEADKVSVFTVNPDNTLLAHAVTLGALLGDRVTILSEVDAAMMIVVDARGLREGQTVTTK